MRFMMFMYPQISEEDWNPSADDVAEMNRYNVELREAGMLLALDGLRPPSDGASVVFSSHRMGELAALCSEVTLLATGRVVFSGPVSKLAADTDELDYRLRTSDPAAARRLAAQTPELRVLADDDLLRCHDAEALLVRAAAPALDELVARLVGAGVGVRELAPVVAPLEAAFLALTAAANVPSEDEDL